MSKLLQPELMWELRDTINETDIFIKDIEQKKKYNLICAMMDRVDDAVVYINSHFNICPENEQEFIVYMFYCCNVVQTIKDVYIKLRLEMPVGNNLFKDIWNKIEGGSAIPVVYNDDKFFSYIRALVFAHQTDTYNIPDKLAGEKQYSPYVFLNRGGILDSNEVIGISVYSDKREDFKLLLDLNVLNEYIKWKYSLIQEITADFRKVVEDKQKVWKKHKVNRNLSNLNILKDIRAILEERYMDTYNIDALIESLECNITLVENLKAINYYRQAIENIIPQLCDAIDEYKHELIYDIVRDIVHPMPVEYQLLHYQIEKIFCNLNENSCDVEWGLVQAEAFANGFAKKWVDIRPREMSFEEIKLLTNVACYLEYQEQKGAKYE